ncbi:VCBS domain-containing protein, partial [Rhizobium sp. LjRoot30]|uniref:VCBS domain-containing protein n=1 Tax=Rhizobium sp. LjRoot30 TaxID=3342320 RepID=UPI003F4FDD2C
MASIQGIYVALFGRPADPAGLEFYNGKTSNGADLTGIGDLASTEEYQSRFSGMTNEQIVNSIYQSLFERDGEAEGVAYFVGELEAGRLNINNIAIAILDGAQNEDLDTVNAKIAAADLFTTHLDQANELAAYNGADAITVGREYIASIDTQNPGTAANADEAILRLFPDEGQGPDGGNGGLPVNTPAVIKGTITGDVIEDGAAIELSIDKLALGEVEYTGIAKGSLTATDPNGTEGFREATHKGTYGSLTIDIKGNWTYTIDNNSSTVQALHGGVTVTDAIIVQSADGTNQIVTISVHGVNDNATFTDNAESYEVVEGVASGTVTVADVDSTETFGEASGTDGVYGSFTFNSEGSEGNWTYQLATEGEKKLAYDKLSEGETVTETLTVTSADGTSHKIEVTI